jgi:hypothetical protein
LPLRGLVFFNNETSSAFAELIISKAEKIKNDRISWEQKAIFLANNKDCTALQIVKKSDTEVLVLSIRIAIKNGL